MTAFIGQLEAQKRIRLWIDAGFKNNVLFRGSAGSGKTTLARIYANAISGGNYYYHLCQPGYSFDRPIPPPDGGVVILDEIHNLKNEEAWYEFPGVLIGCTTEGAPISEPLMTRMTEIWLVDYSLDELVQIVMAHFGQLNATGALAVAKRSRGCPRVAVRLARELLVLATSPVGRDIGYYNGILDMMGTMANGFTQNDLGYLDILRKLGGTASLSTMCAALGMSKVTITQEIEPFLLKQRLITITSKGRSIVE